MLRKILASFILLSALPFAVSAQVSEAGKPTKDVFDASIVGTTVWHSDTVYILREGCYVDSGEVLIIQPGTIIKGDTGQEANAKYLVVSKGGKIYAEGSESCPIIFTSIYDNVDDPNDLDLTDPGSKGLWGGLVLLGRAVINLPGGVGNIEGIPPTARTEYGGADDDDNSGVVRYVSLRHGGTVLAPDQEINGLTMGAVGRKTRIDHVETFMNADDGYEWFGGTVNCKYLASVFNDDDNYDTDQGFRGSVQYGFIMQHPDWGDRFFEQDGANASPWTDLPKARPHIANVTAIGSGTGGAAVGNPILMRENTGGAHYNEIWTEAKKAEAIQIQSFPSGTNSSLNNYLPDGDANDPWVGQAAWEPLFVQNNIMYHFNGGAAGFAAAITTKMHAENDVDVNPMLNGIDYTQSGILDPTLATGSPAIGGGIPNPTDPDGVLDDVTYQGGFDPNGDNWMCYWTFTSWGGIMAPCDSLPTWSCPTETGKPVKLVTDASITGIVYWNSDTVYELTEGIYVDPGEMLIVGPGTVIKGEDGTEADAKYLCVTRGGHAYFNGCEDCPIVMTSIFDNVDDAFDLPVDASAKGLWGGLIVLGNAVCNLPGGVGNIEGIPPSARTQYGGADDDDNSGSYRFISIRHGGTVLAPDNEINGMTFGAVGRNTQVDHIEVYLNADDSYEFFGGTVNVNHMIALFDDDDSFDTDQGYRGSGQFMLTIKHPDFGDRLTEQDGANAAPWTDLPAAHPIWANYTAIGSDTAGAANGGPILERENNACQHFNSLFGYATNSNMMIVQQFPAGTHSSLNNYLPDGSTFDPWPGQAAFDQPMRLINNRYFKFGGSVNAAANSPQINDSIETQLRSQNAVDASPYYGNVPTGTARIDQTNNWDPRPRAFTVGTNPVWNTGVPNPYDPDNVLQDVSYIGALEGGLALQDAWFYKWSFFACGQFYGDNYTPKCCERRGDANHNGTLNVVDLNYLVAFFFLGGAPPVCNEEADANGNGTINVVDLNYLVAYFFLGGNLPVACE